MFLDTAKRNLPPMSLKGIFPNSMFNLARSTWSVFPRLWKENVLISSCSISAMILFWASAEIELSYKNTKDFHVSESVVLRSIRS